MKPSKNSYIAGLSVVLFSVAVLWCMGCGQKHVPQVQPGDEAVESRTSPTIGERCIKTVVSGDETYLMDDLVCVEMHQANLKGIEGWTYAYIVGTRSEALFKSADDAKEWAQSQPYVRRPSQKH